MYVNFFKCFRFVIVGYGCSNCIENSVALDASLVESIERVKKGIYVLILSENHFKYVLSN